MDEFADTQFTLLSDQQQAAKARVIGQKPKKLAVLSFHGKIIYVYTYIRSTIYCAVIKMSRTRMVEPATGDSLL